MRPDLFKIGSFTVHGYGLMIGIGFVLALIIGELRAKKMKLKEDAVIDIAIIAVVSGFLGAKLLYIIVNFKEFMRSPLDVLGSAGFVVYGGLIAGVLCNMIYVKVKKLNFFEYFDLVMPEIALAQAFGRIGCFLAGCCYGRETTLPIGVVFPEHSLAPSGVKLLPTQLMSCAFDFVNMAVLMIIAAKFSYTVANIKKEAGEENVKSLRAGDIGSLYCIFYGIGRFAIEFFRNDFRGEVGPFSTSQFISLFIVALGVGLIVFNRLRPEKESVKESEKETGDEFDEE